MIDMQERVESLETIVANQVQIQADYFRKADERQQRLEEWVKDLNHKADERQRNWEERIEDVNRKADERQRNLEERIEDVNRKADERQRNFEAWVKDLNHNADERQRSFEAWVKDLNHNADERQRNFEAWRKDLMLHAEEDKHRLDAFVEKHTVDFDRMEEDTRRMKKQWGDLANKMGTVAEDVVAPNLPRLALEEFGFDEVLDCWQRARRTSRTGDGRKSEWDIICAGAEKVLMVEVKSSPTKQDLTEVQERMAQFFDFFPEYRGRELIGVIASWSLEPRILPAISQAGLYGIAMGDDTMDVVARPAHHGG